MAEVLVTWFQKEPGCSLAEAEMKVARLAVELNQTEATLPAKDLFVSSLTWPLPPLLERMLRAWEARAATVTELLEAVELLELA